MFCNYCDDTATVKTFITIGVFSLWSVLLKVMQYKNDQKGYRMQKKLAYLATPIIVMLLILAMIVEAISFAFIVIQNKKAPW